MTTRHYNICVLVATALLIAITLSLFPVTAQPDYVVDRYPCGSEYPPDGILVFCDFLFASAVKTQGHGWMLCSDSVWFAYYPLAPVTVVEKGWWVFRTRSVR